MSAPDGTWIAYVVGEHLLIISNDGDIERRINLGQLGGRDHHIATGCGGRGCSYRRPALSWGQ